MDDINVYLCCLNCEYCDKDSRDYTGKIYCEKFDCKIVQYQAGTCKYYTTE